MTTAMFVRVQRWWIERRARRDRRAADARRLLHLNPRTAYYDAHRLAARARFSGDLQGFAHWARVAAEIARISSNPMDLDVVNRIVDDEQERAARRDPQ